MNGDEKWMRLALAAAVEAGQAGEIPVGAVAVVGDAMIAVAGNCPIAANDPTAHAEMVVLRQAAARLGNYRLPGLNLYVTLEPCLMCVGAMIHARIERLVFGAFDAKTGAVQSRWRLTEEPWHNHKIDVVGGVLAVDCGLVLRQFFQAKRLGK